MNYFFTPILLIIIALQNSVQAQTTIQGTVLNDASEPLVNSMISLWRDSTLIENNGTQSDDKGFFKIFIQKSISKQNLNLRISHLGYQTFRHDLTFSTQNIDLKIIRLSASNVSLSTAVVSAQREPVRISGDTTEFAASAYKVQPNAPSEDLLKKVPDVEVNRDGTVKARGETVKQVLINGKPFFGKDPRVALQSLPADAIESVKIYEKKSEQATFSGVDDGEREMTIDLKIKPEYNNRNNGKFTGGFGNQDRHSERGIYNQFSDKSKLTALVSANNINKTGFSEDDFLSAATGNRNGGGRGNNFATAPNTNNAVKGFRSVQTGGANWIFNPNKKLDINFSYFYNAQNTLTDKEVERFNYLSPTNFSTMRSKSLSPSDNKNHRLNSIVDYKMDTFTSVRLTATAAFNNTQTESTIDALNRLNDIMNQSHNQRMTNNNNIGDSWSSSALLRRRLGKAGRTASLQFTYNRNEATQAIRSMGVTDYFRTTDGALSKTDSLNQDDNRHNYRNQYTTNLTYTEPLGKRWVAETSYRFMITDNNATRKVFNIKQLNKIENQNLGNEYDNSYKTHRIGLGARYVKDQKITMGLNLAAQRSLLEGKFPLRGAVVPQKDTILKQFDYVLPNIRFEYSPKRGTRYNVFYETSVQEPSIDQLQPIRDNTDPLNTWLGDSSLRPEYSHRIRVMYNSFQREKGSFWSANVDANWTQHKIVNGVMIDSLSRRINKPLNLNDNQIWFNSNGRLTGGFRWFNQALRVNQSLNGGFQSGVTPINGADNRTQQWRMGTSTRLEYRYQEILEWVLKYSYDFTQTHYDLAASQRFDIQDWEAETNWTMTADTRLSINFDYNLNHSTSLNSTIGIPLLNLSFSRFYFANRSLECRLLVVDALNRNTGVTRTADANYFQTERTRSLGRYGLVMFVYSMNPTKKKRGERQEKLENNDRDF